jgi:hypothetical protein
MRLGWFVFLDIALAVVYYENHLYKHAPHQFESIYERKIADEYGKQSNGFGRSVDIYGNYMLIGSCFDDTDGDQAGSAHLFKLTDKTVRGWNYIANLWVNDTNPYDYFGWDVALTYNIAAVGAWQHDAGYEDNGAVYIFETDSYSANPQKASSWNMTTKLVGFNNGQYFGISVAFSKLNDILYIGAAGSTYNAEEDMENVGAVYIAVRSFTLGRWVIMSTLHPVDGGKFDYYGISVAVDYLTGVVGAYGHNSGAGDASGAVYVYKCDSSDDYYFDYANWFLEARLLASDGQASDYFGRSVAVYEDTVAVGADGSDDSGTSSGAVYIFKRGGGTSWSQTHKLTPPAGSDYDLFGGRVALWGDSLVIGADGDSQQDIRMGSAWFYKRAYTHNKYTNTYTESWNQIFQLTASDRSSRDLYGSDVAIYEHNILIGAEVGDGYEVNSGACYVYTLPPATLDQLNEAAWSSGSLIFFGIASVSIVLIVFVYRDMLFGRSSKRSSLSHSPLGYEESPTRKVSHLPLPTTPSNCPVSCRPFARWSIWMTRPILKTIRLTISSSPLSPATTSTALLPTLTCLLRQSTLTWMMFLAMTRVTTTNPPPSASDERTGQTKGLNLVSEDGPRGG